MLSYQHIYHAGNFADVHKHVALVCTLGRLQAQRDKIRIIDTHAGAGSYDLQSSEATKKQEFLNGINKCRPDDDSPSPISQYLSLVSKNSRGALPPRYYPGSPQIAAAMLRPDDRLTCYEKHPQALAALKKRYRGNNLVTVIDDDGYQSHRAANAKQADLWLIDPAYEQQKDWNAALDTLRCVLRVNSQAVILLWYPITAAHEYRAIDRSFEKQSPGVFLNNPFYVLPNDVQKRLNGSGIIIVNPPNGFKETLVPCLEWLARRLALANAPKWSLK